MLTVFLLAALAASPEQAVRQVLSDQVAAWNRGDIPAFMTGYENSADTTFIGKAVTKGYDSVLQRYLDTYGTSEKMGRLQFTGLEVRMLGADHAVVIGRFQLERSAAGGGPASGIFSLVFRRTASGWKIILDHTS
jgi:uncharacterized protein (TIGR02246 family)